jgi:hypothetical protein
MLTLLSGLNHHLTQVTSAKFQRWVRALDPCLLDFDLRPITLKKTAAILSYEKVPAGPSIPADSTAPLAPGDYGWYVTGRPHLFSPITQPLLMSICHSIIRYK